MGQSNAFGIKLFQAVSERYAKEQLPNTISLTSPQKVAEYLQEKIGREKKEHFMVISLNAQNQLIDAQNISIGTLNSSLIHPREVFVYAIKNFSTSVILAHNHPSGNLTPSKEDVQVSNSLIRVGKIVGIEVLDHLIISSKGYISMKSLGLF